MARIRGGGRLTLACLILAAIVAAGVPAVAQSLYAIKETSKGQIYLDADFFTAGPLPDPSQEWRDAALEVTSSAVRSVPTGIVLPLRTQHCTLTHFQGLRVAEPAEFLWSFEKGGRGAYRCDPAFAPAFVLFTVEVDAANMKSHSDKEAWARRVATRGMLQMPFRSPDAKCESTTSEERTRLSCRRDDEVNGRPIEERSEAFVRGSTSYVSFNIACLKDQCMTATRGLDDLITAINISTLKADAPSR